MSRLGAAVCAAATLTLAVACASRPHSVPQAAGSKASEQPPPRIDRAHAPDPPEGPADFAARRGWLGVELAAAPEAGGVRVRRVLRGSPAARAGLLPGDLIQRIDGTAVSEPRDIVQWVGARAAGHRLSVALRRGSSERLLAVVLDARPDDDGMMKMSFVGAPAPALEALQTVQGSTTPSLSALRGKVVLLEFWASWCTACRIMVPVINDWYARYSPQGVEVLSVTTDPIGLASRSTYELRIGYPVAADRSGKTTEAYGATALPTLFVLDKQGIVRDVMVGYSHARLAEVEALIERLVAES
jgi:thiol-disulfide isomerase/thioredoxin